MPVSCCSWRRDLLIRGCKRPLVKKDWADCHLVYLPCLHFSYLIQGLLGFAQFKLLIILYSENPYKKYANTDNLAGKEGGVRTEVGKKLPTAAPDSVSKGDTMVSDSLYMILYESGVAVE